MELERINIKTTELNWNFKAGVAETKTGRIYDGSYLCDDAWHLGSCCFVCTVCGCPELGFNGSTDV